VLLALTLAERAEVAEYLATLNATEDDDEELTEEEWEDYWIEECNRRMEDMRSGKTVGIPHEEVMRELKEKYG